MNGGPVAGPIITAAAAVLGVIITVAFGLWRVGANRRYQRRVDHVADLQDTSGVLRDATRRYGAEVRSIAAKAELEVAEQGRDLGAPGPGSHHFVAERDVASDIDQAAALDRFHIAQTRVEDALIVRLGQHWQKMSRLSSLDSSDVNAGDEDHAWDWFHQACAQALNSRRGKLTRSQRPAWTTKLDAVVDDTDSTDPDLPAPVA